MFVGPPKELRFSPNLLEFLATAIYSHQAGLTKDLEASVTGLIYENFQFFPHYLSVTSASPNELEPIDMSSLLVDTVVHIRVEVCKAPYPQVYRSIVIASIELKVEVYLPSQVSCGVRIRSALDEYFVLHLQHREGLLVNHCIAFACIHTRVCSDENRI